MARNSSAGSRVWKVVLTVLVAILVLLIIAELGLRWFISSQVRDGFNQQAQEQGVAVQEDPEVTFGATPLVFGLVQGQLPQMTLNTPSTLQVTGQDVQGTPAANIRIEDMTLSQDNPVAGFLSTTTELPDDYLLAVVQQQISEQSFDGISDFLGANAITDVTSRAESGSVETEFGGGLGSMTFVPELIDGQMTFRVTNTEIFGFGLPDDVSRGITQALQDGVQQGVSDEVASDGTLRIDDFTVIDGGVRVSVSGNDVPLREISAGNVDGVAENTPA